MSDEDSKCKRFKKTSLENLESKNKCSVPLEPKHQA